MQKSPTSFSCVLGLWALQSFRLRLGFLFKSMQCNQTGDSTVGVLRVQGQTCKWVRATARKTEQHMK